MAQWQPIPSLPEVVAALGQAPAQQDDSNLWWYLDASSRQRGGVTPSQIGVLLKRGEVDGLTHVWKRGMASWVELGGVAELREQLRREGGNDDGAPGMASSLEPPDASTSAAVAAAAASAALMGCRYCGVTGKPLKHCSGCLQVFYCSRTCQAEHWKRERDFIRSPTRMKSPRTAM